MSGRTSTVLEIPSSVSSIWAPARRLIHILILCNCLTCWQISAITLQFRRFSCGISYYSVTSASSVLYPRSPGAPEIRCATAVIKSRSCCSILNSLAWTISSVKGRIFRFYSCCPVCAVAYFSGNICSCNIISDNCDVWA